MGRNAGGCVGSYEVSHLIMSYDFVGTLAGEGEGGFVVKWFPVLVQVILTPGTAFAFVGHFQGATTLQGIVVMETSGSCGIHGPTQGVINHQ